MVHQDRAAERHGLDLVYWAGAGTWWAAGIAFAVGFSFRLIALFWSSSKVVVSPGRARRSHRRGYGTAVATDGNGALLLR